jgi:hypothetical protein
MPLPWQQQLTHLLAEFHQAFGHLNWPIYRVQPSRYEKLVDLDEDQLAEVGCIVEIDANGELVYRERNGRLITNAEEATVLVSCLDPIPATQMAPAYATYSHQHPAPQQAMPQQAMPQPPMQPHATPPRGTPQHSMHQSQQMPVPPPPVPDPHPGFGPGSTPNGQQW